MQQKEDIKIAPALSELQNRICVSSYFEDIRQRDKVAPMEQLKGR